MIKLEKLEKGEFFEDAFLVSYRYNKDYLNKMRSLKYKRYVPDKKAWEIPSSELKHLVDLFGVDDINVNAKYLEGLVEEQIRAEVEAELKANYEKLADQRVTAAQKKWKQDQEKKAALEKMSEDEKRKAEDEERAAENARKEHELTIKGLRLDVVDAVAELGLDTGFRNLVAVEDLALISDEEERKKKLTERIKGMKELFDAEVKKQVAKEKAEFLKGHTPPASKEKTGDKSYSDYKKTGNVKGMIGEKLSGLFSEE